MRGAWPPVGRPVAATWGPRSPKGPAPRSVPHRPGWSPPADGPAGGAAGVSGRADQRVALPGGGECGIYRLPVGDFERVPGRGGDVFQGGEAAGGRDDVVAACREFADGGPANAP